jgi:archaellum component FlaC
LAETLDQIEKSLDQLVKTLCHLKKTLDQMAKTLCHLKKTLDQLPKTLDQIEKSLLQMPKTLDQIEQALDQLVKPLRHLKMALDQMAKALCHLKKSLDQLVKTLCHLKKTLDQLVKTLCHLKKTLDQLAKALCHLKKKLRQKTKQLCKESKTLFSFAKPLCRMNGRNSSNNPPTYANRKTAVQPHHHHQHGRIAMVNTSKSTHRPTVALSLPKKVPALIVYAQGIVERLTGNPSFPTPTPTVAAIRRDERRFRHPERRGRCAQDADAPRTHVRREAGARLRRSDVGGAARVVRMAIQHRRRQDVGHGTGHAASQDDRRRPGAGVDGAVQIPGRDQDRRGRRNSSGLARDGTYGITAHP